MVEKKSRTIDEQLDEMALKVMMIEPGDLSVVGELVVLVEGIQLFDEIDDYPAIKRMGTALEDVLGEIVMAELPDTAENFELLGKCIGYMQEAFRKKDDDTEALKHFDATLKEMGHICAADLEEDDLDGEGDLDEDLEIAADGGEDKGADAASSPNVKSAATSSSVAVIGPPTQMKVLESPPVDAMDFLQDLELLSGFVDETLEHLDSIEVNILELEDNPGDLEVVNSIFRPFHTIKGVSGFLNLKNIQKLAHSTENLLDDVRNNVRAMDSNVIEVVLKVGDFLKTMVQNLKKVMDEGPEQYKNYDITDYVNWVVSVQEGGGGAGAAGMQPPVAPAAPQSPVAAPVLQQTPEAAEPEPQEAMPQDTLQQTVGPASSFDDAVSEAGPKAAGAARAQVGAAIKVDVEKLDGLVNAVGELVIMQAMVQANPKVAGLSDPKLTKDLSQLSRITSELQKTAMSMRMVPIRQTFQKMIRLVRDLSKKTGKNVNLVMEGEETEIDRNMVDSIYDPLVHMMRNSVDHGVQMPAERERLGKPNAGTVNLRAYQKGGNMVIEIEDDGQGLNTEKIRRKAIERGLMQESDNLSVHELNNLVFLPGFSTADKITDVSGRGVGMDVVKKAVEKLRGKVEVFSEPGKGSLFVIRLPLTLAIIDGIIVRVGEERYIIPTTAIQESLKPRPEKYNTVHGKGETLMVRNTLVPIIKLYELFNVKPLYTNPCDAIVVVVEAEGKQRAIMVDELLGKQEVVIKNLGGLNEIEGVAGGTILGDGRVGLILDLAGLVVSTAGQETGEQF